jgi:hypothetical protein
MKHSEKGGGGLESLILLGIIALIFWGIFSWDSYWANKSDQEFAAKCGGNFNYWEIGNGIFTTTYKQCQWKCSSEVLSNGINASCINADGGTINKFVDTFKYVVDERTTKYTLTNHSGGR